MPSTTGAFGPIITPDQVADLVIKPLIAGSIAGQTLTTVQSGPTWRIPIVTADPAASWTAEGAEITVTDAAVDELTVTPAKLAGLTVISSELANDSTPEAASVIGAGIVRDLARRLDEALFATTPVTNGPTQTLGTLSGISTVSAGAAYANVDAFSDALYTAAAANGTITSWVTNPATAKTLSKVKEAAGSNKPLLGPDPTIPGQRQILGVPLLTSPYVPTTNNVVWGISAALGFLVIREGHEQLGAAPDGSPTVEVDSSVFFTSDRIALRAKLRVGLGFPAPAAMVKITTTA